MAHPAHQLEPRSGRRGQEQQLTEPVACVALAVQNQHRAVVRAEAPAEVDGCRRHIACRMPSK